MYMDCNFVMIVYVFPSPFLFPFTALLGNVKGDQEWSLREGYAAILRP